MIAGNSYWIHTFQLVNIYISVSIFQNFLFVDAGQKSFGQGVILGRPELEAPLTAATHEAGADFAWIKRPHHEIKRKPDSFRKGKEREWE